MSEDHIERTAAANRGVERTAEQQQAEDARAQDARTQDEGAGQHAEPDMGVGALTERANAAQEAAVRGEGSAASLVDNAQQDPDPA